MDMFIVGGGRPLRGRVAVGGAKNAALPIMAAALSADGPTVLHGVPNLVDVSTLALLLETLGVRVERRDDDALQLEVVCDEPFVAEYDLVRRMRASFCVLGPLVARRGRACVSLPGGCNIGDRPIDLHLKGLRALGAEIRVERGYVVAEADRLRGADIYLGGPFGSTVTGTCNVMAAAALAEGATTIEAAACEPEVVDLGNCLNAMGARISGLGTPFLRIEGVERLHGTEHTIVPDRIEASTLMIAAAITGGRVELANVCLSHMTAVVEKLREIGISIDPASRLAAPQREARHRKEPGGRDQGLGVAGQGSADRRRQINPQSTIRNPQCVGTTHHSPLTTDARPPAQPSNSSVLVETNGNLRPADCIALPFPGIPTDLQAQFMALLTQADGISVVTDKVFPDRFMHAAEMARMGARVRREGPTAIISGGERLSGASVMASDLRASAALVLAALAADGESLVRRIYHLDRGYDRLETKLNHLGADIRRVEDTPANVPASLALAADERVGAATPPDTLLKGPTWLRRKGVGFTRRLHGSE